ncbi:hypothetical protein [Acetobacter okinawensis]|uniref:hypothetical protein n=1 Tax=Acetobacter okinawensis TaxID=1076594 RepID=UPI0039E85666
MKKFALAAAFLCGAPPCLAHAADDAPLPFPSPIFNNDSKFSEWGVKVIVSNDGGKCVVSTTVDMPSFSANVQDMVDSGIFSKKVSPTMGNTAPHYLLNTFEAEAAPGIVQLLFDQTGSPENCHFDWSYVNPDEYGNDKKYKMVSFDFKKSIYQKINWPRFNINNLMKVAQNFRVDATYSSDVANENLSALVSLKENE